jgi:hypothetical protein
MIYKPKPLPDPWVVGPGKPCTCTSTCMLCHAFCLATHGSHQGCHRPLELMQDWSGSLDSIWPVSCADLVFLGCLQRQWLKPPDISSAAAFPQHRGLQPMESDLHNGCESVLQCVAHHCRLQPCRDEPRSSGITYHLQGTDCCQAFTHTSIANPGRLITSLVDCADCISGSSRAQPGRDQIRCNFSHIKQSGPAGHAAVRTDNSSACATRKISSHPHR